MHLVASTVALVGNVWDSDAEAPNAAGKAPSDLAAKPTAPCFSIVDGSRRASDPESKLWTPVAAHLILNQRIGERVTRQMVLPTSSATSSAPCLSIATPTGRPIASPFSG